MTNNPGGYIGGSPSSSITSRSGAWTLEDQYNLQSKYLWAPDIKNPGFGWNSSNDTYGYCYTNTSSFIYGFSGYENDINLDVQSRLRRCIIDSTTGSVKYYLDADDSTKKAGDWLRIVEKQRISTPYSGSSFIETPSKFLRYYVPNWSPGIYTKGQRVVYNGYLWECIVNSTTSTPSAGILPANLDGSDGMVMVEVPLFSTRHTYVSGVHTFQTALGIVNTDGYSPHRAFLKADGTYRPYFYYSAYLASSNFNDSISGVYNVSNTARFQFRDASRNRGSGWHCLGQYEYAALNYLVICEFQDMNSKRQLGTGGLYGGLSPTGPQHYTDINGKSNSYGNKTIQIYNSFLSYRGIENFYGLCSIWVDGVNAYNPNYYIPGSNSTIYLSYIYSDWADITTNNYTAVGTLVNAFVSYFSNVFVANDVIFPLSLGGNITSYTGDIVTTTNSDGSQNSWKTPHIGGSANVFVGMLEYVSYEYPTSQIPSVGGRICYGQP
jgi:hypothetical protein